MKIFKNGLVTGLVLQLAIGPVFFYILNLTLQKTIYDGLIGSLAVALVDFSYIGLAIFGIGKILERKKFKKIFGIVSSLVLIIFGLLIIKNITSISIPDINMSTDMKINLTSLLSSFLSVLFLTISNPLTIVLYTGVLGAKEIEKEYTKNELFVFGSGVGLATFIFMSTSTVLFFCFKEILPLILIQVMNLVVSILLIGYGGIRFIKVLKHS